MSDSNQWALQALARATAVAKDTEELKTVLLEIIEWLVYLEHRGDA